MTSAPPATAPIRRVCVFCGSRTGTDPRLLADASALGSLLAAHHIGLVYGGASLGLMGTLANATLQHGGEAIGVLPDALRAREVSHPSLTHLHLVPSMHARKALMYDLSDAFIALPGGMGTLDELFEILTWAQLGLHHKPCVLINTAHFFDHLLAFLHHASSQALIPPAHLSLLSVADSPADALHTLLSSPAPSPNPNLAPPLPRSAL